MRPRRPNCGSQKKGQSGGGRGRAGKGRGEGRRERPDSERSAARRTAGGRKTRRREEQATRVGRAIASGRQAQKARTQNGRRGERESPHQRKRPKERRRTVERVKMRDGDPSRNRKARRDGWQHYEVCRATWRESLSETEESREQDEGRPAQHIKKPNDNTRGPTHGARHPAGKEPGRQRQKRHKAKYGETERAKTLGGRAGVHGDRRRSAGTKTANRKPDAHGIPGRQNYKWRSREGTNRTKPWQTCATTRAETTPTTHEKPLTYKHQVNEHPQKKTC